MYAMLSSGVYEGNVRLARCVCVRMDNKGPRRVSMCVLKVQYMSMIKSNNAGVPSQRARGDDDRILAGTIDRCLLL